MGAEKQKTLDKSVTFTGVGLHTGKECQIVLRSADEHTGIVFKRIDLEANNQGDAPMIAAVPENVVRACHGTVLANGQGGSVATVEHLMAALAICEVDNATIDVHGPEIPILDGSSAPFVEGFRQAGLQSQQALRSLIVLDAPVAVAEGDRSIVIKPADAFHLSVTIEFEDCLIGRQSLSIELDDQELLERMAKSRTFCRAHEIEALRAQNLIRGGSLDNSIVVDGKALLNKDALRDPQEFVLHKALDLIGDLYLLGAPIQGAITANKPGHDLNTRIALAVSGMRAQAAEATPIAATA